MPFGGLLTTSLIGAGTSIFSGIFGNKAAKQAATQQSDAGERAIATEQGFYNDAKQSQKPYTDLGEFSIAELMKGLSGGKFGNTADFKAPTLEEVRSTPGYEFARSEGTRAINQGQAAAGGAFTGGTLKALDQFNVDLADSTYDKAFGRSLEAYKTNLAKSAQDYSQIFAPVQLGESATSTVNAAGASAGRSIGDIMLGIGNAKASGTVGGANALTQGITGAANDLSQAVLYDKILGARKGAAG